MLVKNLDKQVVPLTAEATNAMRDTRQLINNLNDKVDPLTDEIAATLRSASDALDQIKGSSEKIYQLLEENSEFRYTLRETLLELSSAGRSLRVVSDQIGSPTYTSHLAVILVEAAGRRIRGTYHAVGSGRCSWYEFACEAISAAGMAPDIEPITTADFPRPAPRPANSVLSTRKLESTLGFKLPRWQEGVKEFVRRWMAK